MAQPHALILRAPGTNCDKETAFAFEAAGADAEVLHINRVLEDRNVLADSQILCLPGGFSYGDDLAAGRFNRVQRELAAGDDHRDLETAQLLQLAVGLLHEIFAAVEEIAGAILNLPREQPNDGEQQGTLAGATLAHETKHFASVDGEECAIQNLAIFDKVVERQVGDPQDLAGDGVPGGVGSRCFSNHGGPILASECGWSRR